MSSAFVTFDFLFLIALMKFNRWADTNVPWPIPKSPGVQCGDGLGYLLIYIENLTLHSFVVSMFLYGRLANLFSSCKAIPISGSYLSFEVCVYVALGPALCHVCSRRNDISSVIMCAGSCQRIVMLPQPQYVAN